MQPPAARLAHLLRDRKGDLPIAPFHSSKQAPIESNLQSPLETKTPAQARQSRIGKKSIPERTYAVIKNAGDLYRPILPDPNQRLWRAKETEFIRHCVKWLTEERWLDPIAYVIMPNHIHFIFELGDVDNREIHGETDQQVARLSGSFWQHYYYNRRIRSGGELQNQIEYVRENPVRKRYLKCSEDWPYGWCRGGVRQSGDCRDGSLPRPTAEPQINHLRAIGDVVVVLQFIHILQPLSHFSNPFNLALHDFETLTRLRIEVLT